MINTILVEDDLYIQKHFVDRLAADGEFHLVGVFRDAFEAEKHCDATVSSSLWMCRRSISIPVLPPQSASKRFFRKSRSLWLPRLSIPKFCKETKMGAADSLWYKDHGTEELMSVVKRTLAGEKGIPRYRSSH